MEEFKYFFGYARGDTEFVLKLAKELRAVGANLWLDQLDILGGQRWDRAVEEALKTCQGMIAVLSPESLASDNVMDEVSYALEEGKLVVPVLLRSCDIPFRLRRVQHVDFTADYDAGFLQLIRALHIEQPSELLESAVPEAPLARDVSSPSEETPEAEVEGKGETKEERRSPAEVETERKHELDDHSRPVPRKSVAPPPVSAAEVPKTVPFVNRRPLLLWISIGAYTSFTVLLLSSGSKDDQTSGYMFLGSALLLILGSVISYLGRVRASRICGLGALVQVAILVGMLSLSIGDAGIVIPMNLGIAGAFVGIMVLNAKQERKQSPPNESFQRSA